MASLSSRSTWVLKASIQLCSVAIAALTPLSLVLDSPHALPLVALGGISAYTLVYFSLISEVIEGPGGFTVRGWLGERQISFDRLRRFDRPDGFRISIWILQFDTLKVRMIAPYSATRREYSARRISAHLRQ